MIIELPKLIAWLETKPLDATYYPDETGNCLLFQYLMDNNAAVTTVSYDSYSINETKYLTPREVEYAATGRTNQDQFGVLGRTSTYGEALERALLPVLTGDYDPDTIY